MNVMRENQKNMRAWFYACHPRRAHVASLDVEEDHLPCFPINLSDDPLLDAADAPPDRSE